METRGSSDQAQEWRRRYQALRSRRSVRIALRLAGLVKPLLRRGVTAHQAPQSDSGADESPSLPVVVPDLDLLAAAPPVTIVIPVFNAAQSLRRCLQAVLDHTPRGVRFLVIDDASDDPEVAAVFGDFALDRRPDTTLIRHEHNEGFVASVNEAFRMTDGDVVILNSDTEVPPRWLDQLRTVAYANPAWATVTPLSDNAGAFSAPLVHQGNDPRMSAADAGRAVSQLLSARVVEVPTGHGFCMYVKRAALEDVGLFDEEGFPRGYGEENDFCMRGLRRGWGHALHLGTYVRHVKSASFGTESEALKADGIAELRRRYPDYDSLVGRFLKSDRMRLARARVGDALAVSESPRVRVLYLLHGRGGGTPNAAWDLVGAIRQHFEPFVLTSNGLVLTLHDSDRKLVETVTLHRPLRWDQPERSDYDAALADLLFRHSFELLHVRHLIGHSLGAMTVAKRLGLPVVLSLHDYYLCCPTVHLIDDHGSFCGGICSEGQGRCLPVVPSDEPRHLKHGWVEVWRRRVRRALVDVDAYVITSTTTKDVHTAVYPELVGARFVEIEHGRDLSPRSGTVGIPHPDEPARVLLIGHLGPHKGGKLVSELARLDVDGRIEFHILGTLPGQEPHPRIHVHGVFRRDDLPDLVARIRPAASAVLSVSAETYSHALTESWALGLPAFVSNRGAVAERIETSGAGWIVDIDDPRAVYQQMVRCLFDEKEYAAKLARVKETTWPSLSEMSRRYAELYDALLRARCAGQSTEGAST